jgi:hypothetical protein
MANSMKQKYRGFSKIKFKHHMIGGLKEYLLKIEKWPEISAINPGEIRKGRVGSGRFTFRVRYETDSGFKCLAQKGSGIQDVFLVSSETKELRRRLEEDA